MERVLEPYAMRVDTASSGPEAIESIKDGTVYDLVFMDNMMPGMDGTEATRQIRALGYTRPVVALTADAIVGMREVFLESGFDDYIAKPVQLAALNELIEKWIPGGAPEMEIPGVNTALGLSLYDGDREMFIDFLRFYTEHIPAELDKLRHVSQETLKDYAIDAHTVKGTSAGIGATAVTEMARRAEQMAKEGDLAGVLAENEKFIGGVEALLRDIEAWLGNIQSIKPSIP
jgi:CheY-like chemotaxis protein